MVNATDLQVLKPVIVQETVVDAFASSTILVDILEQFGISGDGRMKPEIPVVLDIYRTSIAARRTFGFIRACVQPAAFQRTAVFVGILHGIVAPWNHPASVPAVRMAFFIKSDVLRIELG